MDQHLYKYLVLYKHLCIPQLGNFVIQNEHARYEEGSGLLHAPKPVIIFTDGQAVISEKIFFDFLANETGVDEVAAIKLFHDFCYRFRNELEEKGSVQLKGVGVLSKEDSRICFQPANDLSELLPSVKPGEKVLAATEDGYFIEETTIEEQKDQWWMYALVLLMLGVGALIFYYS